MWPGSQAVHCQIHLVSIFFFFFFYISALNNYFVTFPFVLSYQTLINNVLRYFLMTSEYSWGFLRCSFVELSVQLDYMLLMKNTTFLFFPLSPAQPQCMF